VRHDLARYRWGRWGFVWDAVNEPETVTAEVVTGQAPEVHVHYHLHLPPGMTVPDLAGHILALPPGSVIVPEEQEN